MDLFNQLLGSLSGIEPAEMLDILVNSGSMILALIAIFASFRVAHTQNQVALFNIRYDAWFELRHVLDFAAKLREELNQRKYDKEKFTMWREYTTNLFNAEFSASLHPCLESSKDQQTTARVETYCCVREIEKTIKANQFATASVDGKAVDQLLDALRDFMSDTVTGRCTKEAFGAVMEEFCKKCEAFEEKHFNRTFHSAQLYHEWLPVRLAKWLWLHIRNAAIWLAARISKVFKRIGNSCRRICKGAGRTCTAVFAFLGKKRSRKPAIPEPKKPD